MEARPNLLLTRLSCGLVAFRLFIRLIKQQGIMGEIEHMMHAPEDQRWTRQLSWIPMPGWMDGKSREQREKEEASLLLG